MYGLVDEHRAVHGVEPICAVLQIAPSAYRRHAARCRDQTLLEWVKRVEVDTGVREGVTTSEAQRVRELEREVKELRRANEILKLASAFFAQAELDRRLKS